MKNIFNKIYSLLFPSYKIISEIQVILKTVLCEQSAIKQKIYDFESILAQQTRFGEQQSETLRNIKKDQDTLFSRMELMQNMLSCLDGLGKHLNVISNTQHTYHQEILSYIKDQTNSVNKIFPTLELCKTLSQKNSGLNENFNDLKNMLESQAISSSAVRNELKEKLSFIEKQASGIKEQITCTDILIKEQEHQFNDFNSAVLNITTILEEYPRRLDEILNDSKLFEEKRQAISQRIEALQKLTIQGIIQAKWQISDEFIKLNYPEDLTIQCPLCGHSARKDQYEKKTTFCTFGGGKIERYVCPACDLIFGPLKMLGLSPLQLQEEYKQNYAVFREANTKAYEIDLFYRMKPEKDHIYLNYGAGERNQTSSELREAGYQVYDYEPFAPVHKKDWILTTREEVGKMQFDGIFSNDLIEHLQFPVEELLFMKSLLKKNGKMYHATGCYEYAFEYTRFHLFFFLGRSLNLLAQKSGLNVELTDRIYPEQSSLRYGIFTKN